jgi:N-methylhydantoinase A
MSVEEAAQAMFNTVNSNMADAISEISTRKGYDVRDFNLLATGGGGPLCGAFVADILGMKKTIVPRYSSSFCAWSMFFLDIGRDYVRSYLCRSDRADLGAINKLNADMVAEALKDVEAFKVSLDDMVFEKSVEMRYQGQYHVLEVRLPENEITAQDLRDLEQRFHALHEELFTFSLSWVPMELINVRLIAKIKSAKLPIPKMAMGIADASKALIGMNDCYFDNQCSATPVFDGLKLEAGNVIRGSAIIQEPTATTVIPANTVCRVDAFGNYIITPEE